MLRIFLAENQNASVGFEPAILGTRGQDANPKTTKAAAMTQVFPKEN
jgi:hypothetical protein